MRTLRRGLLQPEPCLRRLGVIRFTAQAAELQLRLAITCPGRLAQQLESDATVALAVAPAAQQAAKAALRFDHTLARRLLEEASGNPLDAPVPARAGCPATTAPCARAGAPLESRWQMRREPKYAFSCTSRGW